MYSKLTLRHSSGVLLLLVCTTISGQTLALTDATEGFDQPAPLASPPGTTPEVYAQAGIVPVNLCEKLTTNADRVPVKAVARPPYLRFYKEPGFGTKSMRISNSAAGEVMKPAGNPAQAWNIDESLLLLHRYDTTGTHSYVVLDGQSYKQLKVLNLPSVSSENIFWSHQDPHLLFYVAESTEDAGKLMQHDVMSGKLEVIQDFAPMCQKSGLSALGGLLAKPSFDDDAFGYQCSTAQGKSLSIAYQVSTSQMATLAVGKGSAWPAGVAPAPTPSGKQYLLGNKVLDQQLKPTRVTLDIADSHAPHTLGIDAAGDDVLFQSAGRPSPRGCGRNIWNGIGLLMEHGLGDGSCGSIVSQTDGYPKTPDGTDMFASAWHSPRWIGMSSIGYDNLDWYKSARHAPLLFSEIYLVNGHKRKNPEICRIGHHRTFGKAADNASYDPVLGEPNVTLSPNGTRVLFSSDWYDSGAVDTYVLELPSFTRINLHGTWVDEYNYGMITQFRQAGEKFTFRRAPDVQPGEQSIVTSGEGTITGNKIVMDYVVHVTANRNVPGRCEATTAEGRRYVLFECRDNYFGRLRLSIVRPE